MKHRRDCECTPCVKMRAARIAEVLLRDHGCYAKKHEPCVGYIGRWCRRCGRIITLELIERGDAIGG